MSGQLNYSETLALPAFAKVKSITQLQILQNTKKNTRFVSTNGTVRTLMIAKSIESLSKDLLVSKVSGGTLKGEAYMVHNQGDTESIIKGEIFSLVD